MLSGLVLPRPVVIAAHIFKHAWAEFVERWMGFSDIDDVRNGMLLFKPIEHAFDHGKLCLMEDRGDSLVCRLIDPALKNTGLLAYMREMDRQAGPDRYTWSEWADWEPVSSAVGDRTFGWLEGRWLGMTHSRQGRGLHVSPFKRCCWFQATMAAIEAGERRGVQLEVPDFYSGDFL